MAVSQRQLDYIARKVDEFQQETHALHEALNLYVGNVTKVVTAWLESRGRHGPHFQEMTAFLGKSSGFIVEKTGEFEAKGSEGDADGTSVSSSTTSSVTSSSPSSSPAASPHLVDTSTPVSELSEQLKKLTTRVDGLSDRVSSSFQEYTQNRSKDRSQMKKLEDRMNEVENSVHDVSVDVSRVEKKVKKYDEKIDDLDMRVGSIEERQNVAGREKEREADTFKNIQKKTEQRESDQRMLEDVAERVKKIEEELRDASIEKMKKFGEVKMNDCMQRLDKVEDQLLEMGKEGKNDIKELNEMKRGLTECNSKVDRFERRFHPALGFTACKNPYIDPVSLTEGTVVKEFIHIVSNKGDHYSPTTGVFTAPVDGLYVVTLTHLQWGTDGVMLNVVCERVRPGPGGGVEEEVVCKTWTDKEWTNCSDMRVVEMARGDKLYVKAWRNGRVRSPTGFSCFLIG